PARWPAAPSPGSPGAAGSLGDDGGVEPLFPGRERFRARLVVHDVAALPPFGRCGEDAGLPAQLRGHLGLEVGGPGLEGKDELLLDLPGQREVGELVGGGRLLGAGHARHRVDAHDAGLVRRIATMAIMAGTKKSDAALQFIDLALSREIQEQLVLTFKAGPTNLKAEVPAKLRGQPGVFTTPAEWRERGYIMDDETRAKTLPAWKEWF